MTTKAGESKSGNELKFELKYCERCGGLWLRPAGGMQIYCVACGREMNQLPPASKEPETARTQAKPRLGADDGDFDGDEDGDVDAAGGAA